MVLAGKYRIERVLGQGGMGAVLAARHLELGHEVAIKIVLPSALLQAETLARFAREGKAAARLSSPHVARVYDAGQLPEGLPFLVMEMVHGRDLKAILDADGPQPLGVVAAWCRQAADALGEAHAMGIVHRDIKPANVMLSESAVGRSIIKVLDFGVSKLADDAAAKSLTQSQTAIGSPAYMAPEQLLSSKDVDGRADIWALGVVLYELTTGVMPFDAGSIHQLVADIHARPHAPPSRINPRLPRAFDEVIDRCLAKKRDGRFRTMAELERALRPLVDVPALPMSLRPPGAPHTATDPTMPAEKWPSGAGVPTEAPFTADASPRRSGDSRRVVAGALVVAAGVTLGVIAAQRVTSRVVTTADASARAGTSESVVPASGGPLPVAASASAAGAASALPTAPSGQPSSPHPPIAASASAAKPPTTHRVVPPPKEVKRRRDTEEPADVPSIY